MKLIIKPISGPEFVENGECEYKNGIYYINGNSYPEAIVEVKEE